MRLSVISLIITGLLLLSTPSVAFGQANSQPSTGIFKVGPCQYTFSLPNAQIDRIDWDFGDSAPHQSTYLIDHCYADLNRDYNLTVTVDYNCSVSATGGNVATRNCSEVVFYKTITPQSGSAASLLQRMQEAAKQISDSAVQIAIYAGAFIIILTTLGIIRIGK